MNKNVEHDYTYKVEWSEEDGEYVGTVDEFPGLSWLDDSPTKTLAGIRRITKECVEDTNQQKNQTNRLIT